MNILELTMSPTIAEWPEAAAGGGAMRCAILRASFAHCTRAYALPSLLAEARCAMKRADDAFTAAVGSAYGSDACNARYDYRNGATAELRRKRDAFHHASAHWQGLADQVRAQSTAARPRRAS